MKHHKSLTDVIEDCSSSHKTIRFIEGGENETQYTYANLYRHALSVLFVLQSRGLKPGDEVIFFLRDNEKFIQTFWACLLGGMIPVPVAVGISDEHRSKIFRIHKRLRKPCLYADRESFDLLAIFAKAQGLESLFAEISRNLLLTEDLENIAVNDTGKIRKAAHDEMAFIQFSSGSTREPKGVVLTHQNLLATNHAMGTRLRYSADDISLSWMPLTHDLGIIGFHLNMLMFDMSQNLMATDLFSRRPLLWLQQAHEKRATVLCSPNFGYKHYLKVYTARAEKPALDLSCVRVIINGAEPISVDLCKHFLEVMAEHRLSQTVICAGYGLAEAGLAVALPEPSAAFEYRIVNRHTLKLENQVEYLLPDSMNALSFAVEGPVVENCQLRIADETGKDLGQNVIGEIQITGVNVTSGYYADAEANQALFTPDRWLRTGDLGFMHSDKLIVTGRLKDIIFVNGVNYYPHDLEAIAQQHPELELGKVVVAGARRERVDTDDILVFVLHRGEIESISLLARQITALIAEKSGLSITHVIPISRIPKTTSGKIQRRFLVEEYLRGDYDDKIKNIAQYINALTETARAETRIAETLQQLCAGIIENIKMTDNLFEIGTSSLDLFRIHERIDAAYPGVLEITDFFKYPTLSALAGELESRLQ